MALTPEQIQSALKTLKPSQITAQEAPVIMPSTTTPTTNIMPKVTKVVPVSPKQNIMSPSLEVQAWVQPQRDYKKLATPQEIAAFAKMIRAWEDPEQARRGMQKAIDRRLEQENTARGKEPKKYVMTPEMYQAEQNKWVKNIVWATLDVATWLPRFVGKSLWKWAEAIASWLGYEWTAQEIAWATEKTFWKQSTDIWQDVEAMSYKAPKLIWDIASVATAGAAVSKIPAVAWAVWKLWSLWTAWKIAVWALEWAWSQWLYTIQSEQRLPTVKELAVWWAIGGAIPALWAAFEWAKKVLPKISDKADDAANKILTNMNRITKWEQEKFAIQQWKTVWERLKGKWIISWWDESIDALAKWFKASKDKADEWLSLIKWEYKNDYLSTMAREASDFADNTLSPQASRMKELADKANDIWLTMSETNEVKRFFERNNKFTYWRDITAWEKTVRATNLDNYVRNRQLDIAEQNGFSNLKEINKDTQWYKYLLDKLIKNENGRLGNNAVTLTDWIVAGEVAANPQAIALLVWKKVASSNWFRKWVVKILNKLWNAKSEADRLVDIAKIQRIQNEKDLNKFLSLPYKKDANIPTYPLNSSSGVKWVVRPITPTWVIQETKPVLPRATVAPKKTITETGRATHNPYAPKVEPVKTPVPVAPKPNNTLVDLQRSTLHTEVTKPLSKAEARTGNFETQFWKIEDIVFDRANQKYVINGKNYSPSEVKVFEKKPVADFDNILTEKVPVKTVDESYILEIAKQWGQKASMLKQVSDDMVDTTKLSQKELTEYNKLLATAIQKRGIEWSNALESLYNKFWKDVYGKKTPVPTTNTTTPKKQSVLPKPQEKQAVLEGKKEAIPKAKELQPLYQEAKKFKSADDFINSNKKLFHTTSDSNAQKINSEWFLEWKGKWIWDRLVDGTFFVDNEMPLPTITKYSKEPSKIVKWFVDKKANVKEFKTMDDFENFLLKDEKYLILDDADLSSKRAKEIFIENWIDVIIKPYWKWTEYIVVNPKVLKTESQLRKIREEANTK